MPRRSMEDPLKEVEAASLCSLYRFFCRCLQKGHWELARACLPLLHQSTRAGEVESILQELRSQPGLLRDERRTEQQLSWFWLNALEKWYEWDQKPLPAFLKDEAEFLLLLEELRTEGSEHAAAELYNAFLYSHQESKVNKRENVPPLLSPGMVGSLQAVLPQNPRLVQAVIGYLLVDDSLSSSSLEYNHRLLNITVEFLLNTLASLQDKQESHASKERVAEQIYSVLSTMHFNVDLQAQELRHLCDELFKACWSEGNVITEQEVQGSLLRKQNYALVNMYGSVTSDKIKAQIIAHGALEKGAVCELSESERAILSLFCHPEQANPWKRVYFYCLSTGKHFLEQILLTALTLLKREDFSRLNTLLREQLKPLRRLLVLLGWTHCQSIESAKSLLNTLHQNSDLCNDSLLKYFCDGLLFQVETVEWCLEQNSKEIPQKDILRHLYSLNRHSALYTLHHLTNLPELSESDVLKLLERVPPRDRPENDPLHQPDPCILLQQRNSVLFQAFCAMKYGIYALCVHSHKSAQCKDCLPNLMTVSQEDAESHRVQDTEPMSCQVDYTSLFTQYFTKCQYYLHLLPALLRLELMENIFSLNFVSLSDLNLEPSQAEDYAMDEEEEEESYIKGDRIASLDSSLEKGDSLGAPTPADSPQCKDNSISIVGSTIVSEGSASSAVESFQRSSCEDPSLNYLDLKHFTRGSSGFLVDEVVLDTFLKMLKEQLEVLKNTAPWSGDELNVLDYMNISVSKETFNSRVLRLTNYVSEALWRYKVVMSNRKAEEELASAQLPSRAFKSSSIQRRSRKHKKGSKKQMESTSSELSTSESSANNLSARSNLDDRARPAQQNLLIPMMVSPPESLLISCILRGNYTEAHQVALRFGLQSSPSYGELIFMERYQEVIRELAKVEQKIENQNLEARVLKTSNGCSTLKAIGSAAAAGIVFYSISDVTNKLLAPPEGPIPTLQDDFWMRSVHLEQTDPWKPLLEELNPSAVAAFDLACTQANLWKTCKQLLETAERRLCNSLETRSQKPDSVVIHPEGVRGFPAVLQQMSKIINYPCASQGQSELDDKISSQFKCNLSDLLQTCFPALTDDCIVRDITLDHKLDQILTELRAAITSHEPKGNLIQALMDQSAVKPLDVQAHPVRQQMSLLLQNLEERSKSQDGLDLKPDFVCQFFNYIDTLSKVVIQSINTELDQSVDLKVGNPFILLQQRPSQLISHLLFERQIPPDRLFSLLEKESIELNVEQVITSYCCEPLSFCNATKRSQAQSLLSSIREITRQCVALSLPDAGILIASGDQDTEEIEDIVASTPLSPLAPTSDMTQYALTSTALNFLKSKSNLMAAMSCLSANKPQKPQKSGLSWKELRGSKKESPLEMEHIAKECDALLEEFPVLQRFLSTMSAPFRSSQPEGNEWASLLCGEPCSAMVLLGLHSPSATAVITQTFQDAVTDKNWPCALQILDLYTNDLENLAEVKDAVLCCAAADEQDGWQYLFAVKDPTLRCQQALGFLEKWPLDPCREILSYCVCEPDIENDLRLELQNQRKELEVYQKILNLEANLTWTSWQDLKKTCTEDPQRAIGIILEAKDYALCEDWGQFYSIPMELLIRLHCEHLLHLLGKEDTEKAVQLLQRIEDPDLCLATTDQALLQQPGIIACHFLSEYLLTHFQNNLPAIRRQEIRDLYMGSKVLLTLPEAARCSYEHLICSPLLLLEQLLMNMMIEWASVAVQTMQRVLEESESSISTEDVDKLLCTYAGKALDIPFSFRERRPDSLSRIPENYIQSAEPEIITASSPAEPSASSLAERSRFQTPTDKPLRRSKSSREFVPPEKPPSRTEWIPDETEIFCMVCKNERFTMFNRRHHCRRCGRLVCSSCSMKKMVVEGCRENPARVCDQCHDYFTTDAFKVDEEDDECIEEVKGGISNLAEVLKMSKAGELQWWLGLNEAENEAERNEFYYDQAPSASLCSAILNLHSKSYECGYQLIERCCMLSKGLTNPEMDSRLLLDIMKNLLFSAKMMFVKAGRSQDLALCDSYSSKLDLLKILVAASYQDIPCLEEIIRPAAVTRLRNRLLEAEYYNVAIEISTKTGLDPSGVWHAWGMACLKSYNLTGAREKFARCLKVPLDLNQKHIGSKLLEDIIRNLESAAKPILLSKDDDYFFTLKELEMTLKTRCFYYEMMADGGKIQNNTYYQECLYYLHTYGTHLGIIQFYMRHDLMREALLHLLNKDCPGEIFIEGIFVPSYESGKLHTLENLLEAIDHSLESWSLYLIDACKHLQQRNFFNILYELQQFMKDHVRAAMTCIRFFTHKAKSYRDLGEKQNWLIKSKDHLRIYLQEVSRSNKKKAFDTFRKKMSAPDISRHINTVELQLEVTRFLQRCEASGTSKLLNVPPPTLFSDSSGMIDVACCVILGGKNVEEGFGIAFRIIQDFQLDAARVYIKVCKRLIQEEHYSEILQLVKCVSESGIAAENDCDQILLKCIGEMTDMSSDDLEKLIQGMRSDENKIKAFITCRMMRSAYLTAVKQEHMRAIQLVQEVWQVAYNLNDTVVQGICSKWLLEHPPVTKEGSKPSSRK